MRDVPDAKPRTLSGGQQHRIAIARALAMEPDIILFDEPTSALDCEMVGELVGIMAKLAADGMTMVIVTPELDFARRCADRIVAMMKGRIPEQRPTPTMFDSPARYLCSFASRDAQASCLGECGAAGVIQLRSGVASAQERF